MRDDAGVSDVVMPRLSDSMEEGTVLAWLKQVGDEVAIGDELVEIETDKANMAYEADVAGTLNEILAQEGETLPIGTPIARIGAADEAPGEGPARPPAGPAAAGDPPPLPVAKASSGEVPPTAPPAARGVVAEPRSSRC
jgi:pyruvate dehydrogenase E2 component (dihydrolipoamide acetyltransferase)